MRIPSQAAILCGGLGSRLRPITDKIPKPMVPVNGIPFLEHLIQQLKENGIFDFVFMTGYRGDQIEEYFGDGSQFEVKIQYSQGPPEWDTGRRLHRAKNLLKDMFLILYSDNFVQFDLKKLSRFYEEKKKLLCFIVQKKPTGNIRLGKDGVVELYDKTRTAENIGFVELGYMIADKEIFRFITDGNSSFSEVISRLVSEREVAGMTVLDAYHSISDPERWQLMEKYLTPKKILLIDRDGVINRKAPRGEYIGKWSDFAFIPDTVEGLKELSKEGFEFIVISNQAGIGRGVLSAASVDEINDRMKKYLEAQNIPIKGIYVCPHHWEDNCDCRKPAPGMLLQASKDFLFRLDKTFFIGDDPRDCQAAYNAGCKSIFLGEPVEVEKLSDNESPQLIINTFKSLPPFLNNYDYFKNAI
ncbi:HAD-IIIA family hydrolase [Nitrospinaceae bacterium]|nr:HAD-IIIA family hydrolase [Nitrospinaceae bacterium]